MDEKKLQTQNQGIDSNSGELISFINKERISKKVNYKKIFRYFSKCLRKSIIEMNTKFKDLSNINESVISGINMIYHIYFILINYTNNIKLTIFLLERAVLLYTEFIIMSQDKKMVDEIYFIPNINDAVSFSFKKTIGPILLNDIDNTRKNASVNFNTKFLKEISILVRNIYKLFFRKKCISEDSRFISLKIEENMETLDKLFQDKKILSEREIDEFKKYSQICAEQSMKENKNTDDDAVYLNDKRDIEISDNLNSSLTDFLNVVNNEIIESLLVLGSNKKYPDILKKINCILNSEDLITDKLGKIKIILFIFNNDYLNIQYNSILFNNQAFKYMRSVNNILPNGKENIILSELRERLFDNLVSFKFKEKFIHECSEKFDNLSIDIKSIEKQLDEILTFIQ